MIVCLFVENERRDVIKLSEVIVNKLVVRTVFSINSAEAACATERTTEEGTSDTRYGRAVAPPIRVSSTRERVDSGVGTAL